MQSPFFAEALARTAPQEERHQALPALEAYLQSPELQEQIDKGDITLAMVRPDLGGNTLGGWPDEEAAKTIEAHIQGLGVRAKFSLTFDQEAVDAFYAGRPKDAQSQHSPDRYLVFRNRWQEFSHLMTSGPATVLLLQSSNHDAIELWRNQVGHFDIVNRRDPANIRGKFGLDNYNNLVHGSDSIESVHRELGIILGLIDRQLEAKREPLAVLGGNLLNLLGVDPQAITTSNEGWKRTGETYTTDFFIGNEHLIAKACTKFAPSETMDEWLQRRQQLQTLGIKTPELKARQGALIVEEYIPFTLRQAYEIANEATKQKLERQFVEMYGKVIDAGFRPGSLHDVRSHGDDVVMVDFGEDLGGILPDASAYSAELAAQHAREDFHTLVD